MLYEEDINDYFDYCHLANFAKQYVLGRMIRFNTDFAENLHIDEDATLRLSQNFANDR